MLIKLKAAKLLHWLLWLLVIVVVDIVRYRTSSVVLLRGRTVGLRRHKIESFDEVKNYWPLPSVLVFN
jgi:hypothetical protein